MELAAAIPHLDVVVGGHTHSFLYSGDTNPSNNKIEVSRSSVFLLGCFMDRGMFLHWLICLDCL